jgi:hypothetical protein
LYAHWLLATVTAATSHPPVGPPASPSASPAEEADGWALQLAHDKRERDRATERQAAPTREAESKSCEEATVPANLGLLLRLPCALRRSSGQRPQPDGEAEGRSRGAKQMEWGSWRGLSVCSFPRCVLLQSGNADIAARGAQDLRVHQHHQLSGLTARAARSSHAGGGAARELLPLRLSLSPQGRTMRPAHIRGSGRISSTKCKRAGLIDMRSCESISKPQLQCNMCNLAFLPIQFSLVKSHS